MMTESFAGSDPDPTPAAATACARPARGNTKLPESISKFISSSGLDATVAPAFDQHEQVVFCRDAASGLQSIIAIHSTARGPALGGCRLWPYTSEAAALDDVLRLSKAMSYKHAVANLPQGGGKAVILAGPRQDNREGLFHAFGRFVDIIAGQYITAEDVGIKVQDLISVRKETPYVAGLPLEMGGSGDPSPMTAYGVFCGLRAAIAYRRKIQDSDSLTLRGLTVAVQGLGNVGRVLCRYLHDAGARLVITDIRPAAVEEVAREFHATPVKPEEIFDAEADVFAPCALGGSLSPNTIPRLRVSVIAGSANNQLSCPEAGQMLKARGILYAPDYVINAGGVINISYESTGYDKSLAAQHTARIGHTLTEIFARAEREHTTTDAIADRLAQENLGIA